MKNKFLPPNSKRRQLAKKIYRIVTQKNFLADPYQRWAFENNDKIKLFDQTEPNINKPLISVIVPAFNTPKNYLLPCIHSVVSQIYENWELIIVDASTDKHSSELISRSASIDKRIKVYKVNNKGIAGNTNEGIERSIGEYVGFLDHDDLLTEDALLEMVKGINQHPDATMFYSDEDKVTHNGKLYLGPHFKPDWSPDLLTHVNYITHFTVAKKTLLEKVGGLDSDKDGAQDYDLVLRIADTNTQIVHIPQILYHWRIAINSTAADVSNKPYIKTAGERALKDHYQRLGIGAEVQAIANKPGFYKTKIKTKIKPTIYVSNFANNVVIDKYVELLRRHLPDSTEIIRQDRLIKWSDEPRKCIEQITKGSTEHVVFINDFVFPKDIDWATELTGLLELPHMHTASSLILRNDNTIEDAGIVTVDNMQQSIFRGKKFGVNTYFGDTDWTRNVDALSGRVVAARKDEVIEFLNKDKKRSLQESLKAYSEKSRDRYNTVLSTSTLEHLRSRHLAAPSRFMNQNLLQIGQDFEIVLSEQQILDALMQIEERLDEK